MKRVLTALLSALIILTGPAQGFAESSKIFKTKYTTIHYSEDKDLDDFLWRLGGTRVDILRDKELALSRVDRIVERVQTITDIWIKDLDINVYLQRGDLKYNQVAFYQHKNSSIYLSVDKMSDGVFAHEVTHAIINRYYTMKLPSKTQEIITQYVDKYLWNDYYY